MTVYNSKSQLVAAGMPRSIPAPFSFLPRKTGDPAKTPVYQLIFTWLVFWPLLTLAARRTVYFGGPPADVLSFKYGFSSTGHDHFTTYVTLLYLASFVLVGYRQIWRALRNNPLIACCLVYGAASAMWSAAPQTTLQMSLAVCLCSLFACYLSERLTPERLMSLLIFVGTIAAVLSILFALFLPRYGISWDDGSHPWRGICNQKNEFGMSMAFLLTPIFFTKHHRSSLRISYAILLSFLILMSKSRGAWLVTAGVFSFVGWLALYRRLKSQDSYLLITMTLALFVVAAGIGFTFLDPLTRLMGKDPSLTGRTGIYTEVFKAILKHPFIGYGFGSFWIGANPESTRIGLSVSFPTIGYAENGVLELALQVGLFGVGLVLTIIGKALLRAVRLIRSPLYNPRVGWYATILILELLTNIDAGWLMVPYTLDWVLTLIACIGLASEMQHARQVAVNGFDSVAPEQLDYK